MLAVIEILTDSLASHAGVFRGARFSFLPTNDEKRAPLKMPAWEATDSRKRAQILADNRKNHHPIETLSEVFTCSKVISAFKR